MLKRFVIILIMITVSLICYKAVFADEYDDISKQIEDFKKALDSSQNATRTNEAQLNKLNDQLNNIKAQVSYLEKEIVRKEKQVKEGEDLMIKQKEILDSRTVSYYKNINSNSLSLVDLLLAENLSESLRNFFYQKSLSDQNQKELVKTALYIKDLEDKKQSLQTETVRLATIKADVDKQSQFLASEVEKAKKWESELTNKIASLTARQQQIIAQKQASLHLPTSAGSGGARGCSDDRPVDPGFSPRFAFFTFGAPHRVGLNQYGAYGRAKAGQSYDTILHAYYNFDELKDYDTNTKIKVDGQGEFSLEDYVKRIYEVPNDWGDNGGMEALKAQAIAARSYALAYTHNGADSICTTEECQVFQPNEKGGNWGSAVDATRGKVMMQGGNPVKAWFASTHGGYGFSSAEVGWSGTAWTKNFRDTSGDVNSFQDLMDKAYDKDSPWFYCDWGSRSEYHNTAWLKSEEVADIANALMLAKADGSVASHLSQPDKPNPDGTDTWDRDRVKKELRDRGGSPFNSVSDIGIDWDKGSGKTTNVKISGDAGSKDFNPGEWKNFFNVRAPANIQIVGPLFNIEKR